MIGHPGWVQPAFEINAPLAGGQGNPLRICFGYFLPGPLPPPFALLGKQPGGEPPGRAAGVKIRHPKPGAELLLRPGQSLHGVEGIPPKEEVIIVHPNIGPPQHPPQQQQHLALRLALRFSPLGPFGRGQSRVIDFSVCRQGDAIHPAEPGGQHISGQIGLRIGEKLRFLNGFGAGVIGHQVFGALFPRHRYHGGADFFIIHQPHGDFLRLNAKAPELDLGILPPPQHNFALRRPAAYVPGAVKPLPGLEGAWEKRLLRALRQAAIAPAHAQAANVNLAVYPDGQRHAVAIQHIKAAVFHRFANGEGGGVV